MDPDLVLQSNPNYVFDYINSRAISSIYKNKQIKDLSKVKALFVDKLLAVIFNIFFLSNKT